jgi:hypothetical protein
MNNITPLNDAVAEIHVTLWSTAPDYRGLLNAVHDEDSVEGSLACDDYVAAVMIRNFARGTGNLHVKNKKLATIIRALHVVMMHHGISREERANIVGNEIMASE